MRSPFALIIIALVASLGLSMWFNPMREATFSGDPVRQLGQMAARDGELASALASADGGNPAPLLQWINRADILDRQVVAQLLLRTSVGTPPDDRVLYRQRHRLLPFTSVTTGNPRLDQELDNAVAYALVAGTKTPTPEDIRTAVTLAARLAKPASEGREHAWFDTIGCVRFVAADAVGAIEAFTQAVTHGTADHAPDKLLDIYRRRKAASERLATNPAEPLILEWPTP